MEESDFDKLQRILTEMGCEVYNVTQGEEGVGSYFYIGNDDDGDLSVFYFDKHGKFTQVTAP